MDTRPSWDSYFMEVAELVSTRGTCDRKRVGAVLVKGKRIIATGYNGSIPGQPHCDDPETFHQCNKCGKKFLEPDPHHNLPCMGYGFAALHGGHDLEDGHCVRTIHAEENAIAQATRFGIATEDATLYCNTMPCWKCFKDIVSAGIREVVYRDAYRPEKHRRVLAAAKAVPGFVLRQYTPESE